MSDLAPPSNPSLLHFCLRCCLHFLPRSEQVTFDEFKKMLRVLGLPLSDSEVGTVFKAIDADGNGMLDINEIHTGCRAMRRKLLGLADHEELPPANPLPPRPPPRT